MRWQTLRAQAVELAEAGDDKGIRRAVLDEPGFVAELFARLSVRRVIMPLLAAASAPAVDGPMPGTIVEALKEPVRYRLVNGHINPDFAKLGDKFSMVAFKPPCNNLVMHVLNFFALPGETQDDVRKRMLCFATTSGGVKKFMAQNDAAIVAMSFTLGTDGGLVPCCAPGTVTTHEQLVAALPKTKCLALVKVLQTPAAAVLLTVDLRLVVACTARCVELPEGAVTGVSTATGKPVKVEPKPMGSHSPWPGAVFASDAGAGADAGSEVEELVDVGDPIDVTPGVTVAIGGINNVVKITVDGEQLGQVVCALALPVAGCAPIVPLNMQGKGKGMRPFGLTVLGYLRPTEFKDNEAAVTGARTAPAQRTAEQVKAIDQRTDAGEYSAGKRVG